MDSVVTRPLYADVLVTLMLRYFVRLSSKFQMAAITSATYSDSWASWYIYVHHNSFTCTLWLEKQTLYVILYKMCVKL